MEFQVKGHNYRIGKMNVFIQLHVSRKLAPLLISYHQGSDSKSDFFSHMGPVCQAFSQMTHEDAEYVVNSCMAVVFRQEGEGWQKVQASPGTLQYNDIDLDAIIILCVQTIKENLGSFISGLLSKESEAQA